MLDMTRRSLTEPVTHPRVPKRGARTAMAGYNRRKGIPIVRKLEAGLKIWPSIPITRTRSIARKVAKAKKIALRHDLPGARPWCLYRRIQIA